MPVTETGYSSVHAYKLYLKTRKGLKEKPAVSHKSRFAEICAEFNEKAMDVVMKGHDFVMPEIGSISIIKIKSDKDRMDMVHFRKTGEKKPLNYNHSEGYYAMFLWNKRVGRRVSFMNVYKLKVANKRKKELSEIMLAPGGYKIFREATDKM